MASICMPWNTYYIYSDQLSKNEGWHVLMWNESQKPGAFSLSNPDFVPSMFLHSLDPMTNPHLRPTFLQGPYHAPEGVTGLQLGAFSSAAPRKQGGGGGDTGKQPSTLQRLTPCLWKEHGLPWTRGLGSSASCDACCSHACLGTCPVLCHVPTVQRSVGAQWTSAKWPHNSFGAEHTLPGTFIFLADTHLISSTRSYALCGQGKGQGRIWSDLTVGLQGFYWTHFQLLPPFLWEYQVTVINK